MHCSNTHAPAFRDHVTLHHMVIRLGDVAVDVVAALQQLQSKVLDVLAEPLPLSYVRVPLDIQRPVRRRLQWRALTLSENRVGANTELMQVLLDLQRLRAHSENVLPLLVDEKVHYAISRMMLSRGFVPWDVSAVLEGVPLLYGVCTWHCWGHCVQSGVVTCI